MNKPFKSILNKIKKFRDDRDWKQFHNPKDMAEAIVIEASELLEVFLWKNKDESEKYLKNKKNFQEFSEELADVFIYSFELADKYGIDIEKIITQKLSKNAKKYPVNKAKGITIKYTKL